MKSGGSLAVFHGKCLTLTLLEAEVKGYKFVKSAKRVKRIWSVTVSR